ncbi:flagellar motor protein [Terriglobus roseus DSM 18391]|uniref:Flagellar motor protein n=1 Tax=Terriglobus roseus (strain DSM 18391 / NRRL B-41598 / KBS 63) TaxID=926566 RepID=I3ZJQ1_TERRK|nr:OmpA family protein [Terriglobus roseus]AFL89469.1 flagellar motor protein [Terriglobus roseus DSM 18391]
MNKQNIFTKTATFGVSALLLTGALSIPSHAQAAADQTQTTTAPAAKQDATDKGSYATGTPLQMQSKEGFWGHMNPLARKKWVKRQMDPIKDRVNELDQLQSKNANDIRDVDSRATAGIKKASDAALIADTHAAEAGTRADAANSTATAASTRTDALHGTVTNLDQYSAVTSTPVAFPRGRTTLGTKAKADLDEVASKLANEKGYIIEVQGYSRAGVGSSTAMADSVVRYLVTEHQVPIYKIYRSGLGKASAKSTPEGEKTIANGVRVTLLHNSLATMDGSSTVSNTANPSNSNISNSTTNGGSLQ